MAYQTTKYLTGQNDIGDTVITTNPMVTSGGKYVGARQTGIGTWAYQSPGGTSALASILGAGNAASAEATPSSKDLGSEAAKSAIGTAQTGLDAALSAQSGVAGRTATASADLNAARMAASGIGSDIAGIRTAASDLSPYIGMLAGAGQGLLDSGNDLSRVAQAIRAGDSSMGGILGAYIDSLQMLDPNRYVAGAAQDVQSSFDNAAAQSERALSRQGVNPSSGAYATLRNQLANSLAVARAAAMTRARERGLSEKTSTLQSALQTALSHDQQARDAGQAGLQGIEAAAQNVQKQGDLFSTAGSLGGTQTSVFANIGGVEVNLGNLDLSSSKNVQDAIQNVTAAQEALANFYAQFAETTTEQVESPRMNEYGGFNKVVTTTSAKA